MSATTSEIDFHRGNMLLNAAGTYPNLRLTLVECVQNALDADADRIMVCINLKNRSVIVADNGKGTDRAKFEAALRSVGKTVKNKDKLGKFGLGLVSPLNKCASFKFISTTSGTGALMWTFSKADIAKQDTHMSIPLKPLLQMPTLGRVFSPYATDEFAVTWHTIIFMEDVVQDRIISVVDLDEFHAAVDASLGIGMRNNKAVVRVVLIDDLNRMQTRDINPATFTGDALKPEMYPDQASAGRVEFELYRAPKSGGVRNGTVYAMVLGDNTRITMQDVLNQARGRGLSTVVGDALMVLCSGYFEGVIECENLTLLADRKKFEYNEALRDFYLTLDQWYDEHGKAYFHDEEVQTRESRWQDLGLRSQERLRDLLRSPAFTRLLDNLTSIVEVGRLGDGHRMPAHGRIGDVDDSPSTRVGQGGAGKSRTPQSPTTPRRPARAGTHDRPGDVPMGVVGPSGRRRQLVTGDSQGLWFGHDEMPGNSKLWEFDATRGVLWFNTRHPVWYRLDETKGRHLARNEKWLMHLMEYLALEVLHLLAHFPDRDEFEAHRDLIDDKVGHYVEAFIAPSGTKAS